MLEFLHLYVSGFWVWAGLTAGLWIAMAAFGMAAGFMIGLLTGGRK